MGKIGGFLELNRLEEKTRNIKDRIKDYSDFHLSFAKDDIIKSAARCMNCGVPFCQSGIKIKGFNIGCPLNNLIPEWNDLVYKGLWNLAYERLHLTSPFPEFTGRVCPALCEKGCTCQINSEAVNVKNIELAIIEHAFENGFVKANKDIIRNGKKVLIVGSGPSGLAAANKLNKLGYHVTVREKEDKIGGLLRYGIPNMKLEKNILDRRINILIEEGIIFKTNEEVRKHDANYDAIIYACGTTEPRNLNVPGKNIKGVHYAIDYLKESTKALYENRESTINAYQKNVVIIGGGDTGNDLVATAIRQGAKRVFELEIMNKAPEKRTTVWPENPNALKTDYGIKEAIEVYGNDIRMFKTTATEIIGDDKVKGVKIAIVDDNFKPINETEQIIDADLVLIAMGFVGTNHELANNLNLILDEKNNVIANENRVKDNVFVCGDMRTGQSLVVLAIKDGLSVAENVHKYLCGDK